MPSEKYFVSLWSDFRTKNCKHKEVDMTQKHQIQLFEEKKVRTVWDEELQEWLFSVVDIVQVLTDSADVKQYIQKMRKRDLELEAKWGTICTPVRMLATDGK